MLTYLVVCIGLLQASDNPLERKHPPAMHGTVSQEEFMKVETSMVIRTPRMLWKDVLDGLQVRLHVSGILLSVVC